MSDWEIVDSKDWSVVGSADTTDLKFFGTTGRSAKNNNPLNLEYRPGSYQDKYGAEPEPTHNGRFAKFPTIEAGYLAGLDQIKLDASRGHTLSSFVNKFAPPHENPTNDLIVQYGKATGANADTPLSEIDSKKLIDVMLARESSTKVGRSNNDNTLNTLGKLIGPTKAEASGEEWEVVPQDTKSQWEVVTPIKQSDPDIRTETGPQDVLDIVKNIVKSSTVDNPNLTTLPDTMQSAIAPQVESINSELSNLPPSEQELIAPLLAKDKLRSEQSALAGGVQPEPNLGHPPNPLEEILAPAVGIGATEGLKIGAKSLLSLVPTVTGMEATSEALTNSTLPEYVKLPLVLGGGIAAGLATGRLGQFGNTLGKGAAQAIKGEGTVLTREGALAELQANINKGMPFNSAIDNISTKYGTTAKEVFDRLKITPDPEIGFATKVGTASTTALLTGEQEPPVPPNSPTMPAPPVTVYPKSVEEFANSLDIVKQPRRNVFQVPDNLNVPKLDPTIPELKGDMWITDLERSANIVSSNYLGPENNLVGDYSQSIVNFNNIVPAVSRVFSNIVRKLNLQDDIRESKQVVLDRIGPIFKDWRNIVKPQVELESAIASEKSQLPHFAKGSQEAIDSADRIVKAEAKLALIKVDMADSLKDIYSKRAIELKKLGEEYANVRIKAAAEGDQWALDLIKPEEQLAVEQTRKYLDLTASRMTQIGMKTFTDPKKNYVPYIFQTGEYGDVGSRPLAERLWYGSREKPDATWLDFMSRQPESKDWFPLWHQSMSSYIPSAERKLAFNPFLRKWTPAIIDWKSKGFKNAAEWGTNFINRNMNSESTNAVLRGLDKFTNFEYFHYLAGSTSTAFLHLFKLMQTPMWHGFIPTIKAVGDMTKILGESSERTLYQNYVQARMLTRELVQAPGMNTFLEPEWWKGVLNKALTNPITNPTRLIEAWDNGVNMFAALHSGIDAGASSQTINRAILESQMLLNFRGFTMPRAFTTPGLRLATMFQGTPFKLAENKIDLIKKALSGSTDIYGRSDFNKLIRFIVLTGMTWGAGKEMGLDLSKQAGWPFHEPFLMEGPSGNTVVSVSPPIKTYAKFGESFEAGLKQWSSTWGPIQKVVEDYVPQKYNGSKLQQMLGVPSQGWEEQVQGDKELKQIKRLQSDLTRSSRKPAGKVDTPFEFLMGLIGEK